MGSTTPLPAEPSEPTPSAGAPGEHTHFEYLAVTVAIALWQGMIGVLVKWSTWPPVTMVWARCVITVFALWSFGRWRQRSDPTATTSAQDGANTRLATWVSGALLAAHWITLFLGYRYCNVGPVVVALFTFPVMAALLEPWFFGHRPQMLQLFTACIATGGVAAMRLWDDDAASASQNTLLGIALGLSSAAFFTARSIIARKLLRRASALQIMQAQAIAVAVLLLPSTWLLEASHWSLRDVLLVIVLGVGFTAIPHTLGVWSMKRLTVATSGVIGSLQTLSTLVLARVFVGESISWGVWLGALAVMLAVVVEGLGHSQRRAP